MIEITLGVKERVFLRPNWCRGNLEELNLKYLVLLGHGVVVGIIMARDSVVLLGYSVFAGEQRLMGGVGLGKHSSECSNAKQPESGENEFHRGAGFVEWTLGRPRVSEREVTALLCL